MTAPFAAIEAATAASALAALANVEASIDGGALVPGIFDAAYADELGIAGTGPVLRINTADAPSVAQGSTVEIGADSYTVINPEPDGTGMTQLRLQLV